MLCYNEQAVSVSVHPINVASIHNGGRCTWAPYESYPFEDCSLALERTGWSWMPYELEAAAMTITFNDTYRINKARIMHHISFMGLAKTIELQFSDQSKIRVSIYLEDKG